LRLKNTLCVPVCFRIRIDEDRLIGSLCAPESIREYLLRFDKVLIGEKEKVDTLRRSDTGEFEVICKQSYAIAKHDTVL